MFWSKGSEADKIGSQISVIGTVKRDSFNGGFYVHGETWLD